MKQLNKLEETIGITFTDKNLLELAFIHKSYVNEVPEQEGHNERLEFLGDAVLELSVTDHIFRTYPGKPEGELTNWRSALVKGKNLAKVAKDLDLGAYLKLSRGEELSEGRKKTYILANTLEALIGAIYLDKGYDSANEFILKFIVNLLDEIIEQGLHIDAKSKIQEIAQDKLSVTPRYDLLEDTGPDHDKIFVMGLYFEDELVTKGEGPSKQDAEQDAAKKGLEEKGWL